MKISMMFNAIVWLATYCYLGLSDENIENAIQVGLAGELLRASYTMQNRQSRSSGINYTSIIPNPNLQGLISTVKIQFSEAIPEEEHKDISKDIQEGLSQRINHELLNKVLRLPAFSIKVIAFDEFSYLHETISPESDIGGYYDGTTNTIYLNHLMFQDQLWSSFPTIRNELSGAATYFFRDNQNALLIFLHEAKNAVLADIKHMINALYSLTRALKINQKLNDEMEAYAHALSYFHPGASCSNSPKNEFFSSCIVTENFNDSSKELKYGRKSEDCYIKNMYIINNKFAIHNDRFGHLNFFVRPSNALLQDKITQLQENFDRDFEVIYRDTNSAYSRTYDNHPQKKALQIRELISFIDSYPNEVKESFFPNYCKVATSHYQLFSSFCSP